MRLVDIVARLRSPSGCLWDRAQEKEDIARYLLEEAYEVVDAIEGGTAMALREELGDLFFHIVFLARLAEERAEFDLADVLADIEEKMIRRHPHVFGDRSLEDVAAIKESWEAVKRKEGKGLGTGPERFTGIAKALPALTRAQKIGQLASKVGFDWDSREVVLKKVEEEMTELKAAIWTLSSEGISEEVGDLLFSLVNLCRFLEVDAETALRGALHKFIRRFTYVEEGLAKAGKKPEAATPAEMDRLWEEAKALERK